MPSLELRGIQEINFSFYSFPFRFFLFFFYIFNFLPSFLALFFPIFNQKFLGGKSRGGALCMQTTRIELTDSITRTVLEHCHSTQQAAWIRIGAAWRQSGLDPDPRSASDQDPRSCVESPIDYLSVVLFCHG